MTDLHEKRVEAAAKALEKLPLNIITRGEAIQAARAALAAADAHLPSVEQIAEVLAALPEEMVEIESRLVRQSPTNLERARAVRALFGEVAGDE